MKMHTVIALGLLLTSLAALPCGAAQTSRAPKSKVVWDYWYAVAVKSLPYEMENDKVILEGDKLRFQEHVWKKEEGFINQEELGAFAMADMSLTPLFFNYRSAYRTTETVVDGTVHDGKNLVVNVRKAGQSLPTISHSISSGTFFEVFFPLWIGKELKILKTGQTGAFTTIFEDGIEDGFDSKSGSIRIETPDDFANKTHTTKLAVDISDLRTYWWVDSRG